MENKSRFAKFFKPNRYKLINQKEELTHLYPNAECKISRGGILYWNAEVRPSVLSKTYKISLEYKLGKKPIVLLDVRGLERYKDLKFPHNYGFYKKTGKLNMCLFYRNEFNSKMLIAHTIVPWIVEWLYFYEIWLITGEWCGGGKHLKRKDKIISKTTS